MPASRPRIAAGTARVSSGAPTITAAVTPPISALCHCQFSGEISVRHSETLPKTPRNFGIWLPMMIRPTPVR
ncbi:MAG: hypothetical protein AW07_04405 [Candidatus Accumulibacter sp. SK-11]|nr:MAG: hypothetical protein AW07_04405 [Candidatus Accumulibacter sp. SK-11]